MLFLLSSRTSVLHKSLFSSLNLVEFISAHVHGELTVDYKQALCWDSGRIQGIQR